MGALGFDRIATLSSHTIGKLKACGAIDTPSTAYLCSRSIDGPLCCLTAYLHHPMRLCIEAERFATAALQDRRSRGVKSGVHDPTKFLLHHLIGIHQEPYVEQSRIGIVGRVLVVHQDKDEAVLANQHGKLTRAAGLLDAASKARLEKTDQLRNVRNAAVDVIQL